MTHRVDNAVYEFPVALATSDWTSAARLRRIKSTIHGSANLKHQFSMLGHQFSMTQQEATNGKLPRSRQLSLLLSCIRQYTPLRLKLLVPLTIVMIV